MGKKNLAKGVRVVLGENDSVDVEICYLAKYGYSICDVAKNVQEAVRSSIEAMTGLKASSINIYVGGVMFDETEENTASAVPEASEKE